MTLNWEPCRDGYVPADAVCGGWDAKGGEPLYIGKPELRKRDFFKILVVMVLSILIALRIIIITIIIIIPNHSVHIWINHCTPATALNV